MKFTIETIDDFDIADEDSGFGIASLRTPKDIKEPVEYLLNKKEFNKTEDTIKNEIRLSRKLHRYEGIVGSGIDAYTELSVTNMELEPTGEKKLDEILLHFMDNVNSGNNRNVPGIKELSHKLTHEEFVSGNAFPFKYWGKMETLNGVEYFAPKFIYLLDPLNITLPVTQDKISNQPIEYVKNDNTLRLVRGDGRTNLDASLFKRSVKRSERNKIYSRTHNSSGIELNPNLVSHFKRKSLDYERWGIPYLSRSFQAIASLQRLRDLDENTIESLINLVTIFKVGTEERPASPARLKKFAQLFNEPKATSWLVWAHDIDIEQVGAENKVLTLKDSFAQKYEEIFIAMGLPPALFGITGKQKGGDSYNQMLVLMARLQYWRDTLRAYYERLFKEIAEANGFMKIQPKVFWHDLELNKDIYFKEFIIQLYDRGLLDAKLVVQKAGLNFESVIKRLEELKKANFKDKLDLGVPPNLPFSGQQPGQMGDKKTTPKIAKPKQNQVDRNKTAIKKAAASIVSSFEDSYLEGDEDSVQVLISDISSVIYFIEDLYRKTGKNPEGIPDLINNAINKLVDMYKSDEKVSHKDQFLSILNDFIDSV